MMRVTPRPAQRIAWLALAAAIVATAGAMVVSARVAEAHARYEDSVPGKGEVVQTSPARVEITFSQEIQKVSGTYAIEVNKDRGLAVTAGSAEVNDDDRTKMSVELQPDLDPGRYVVHYRNVSDADGDPYEGAFSFYVQTEPNAVDLENDRALEEIGGEDVTPPPAPTATVIAPEPTDSPSSPATEPTRAGTIDGDGTGDSDDDGGTNIALIVGIALGAVAAVGAGFVGWRLMQRT